MISRAVFLAACFAAAAGGTFNLQCTPTSAACGGKCCGVSWTLGGTDGSFTCTKKGAAETCGLCGQDGLEECAFTMENSGAPVAELVDTHGNAVEVSAYVSGGSTGRLRSTRPSSGVTMTLGTYSGMNGWFDIPASSFYGFAEFLLGLTATVPSFYTDTGFTVRYSCKKPRYGAPADFKGCNIFFFVYKCPPCQRLDAGISAKLMAMDEPRWFAGQCGPTFKLNRDLGADHGFAVWQADIEDGSVVSMTMDSPIEFIFWAMVGKSVVCSARLTEANCDAAPDNCEWLEEGVCRPRGCPKPSPFHGAPTPKCQVCVDDEEEFIPRVIV
ncbi:hypothetical protein DIPPA_03564 [Diplonema papillatum]|nr:hypothetical protein DIPPA_03557 [Diplonema papillatum]KAJ9448431.1 hypothetical protein DIPPA_03564 [Diplonema papillatum]